MNEHNVRSVRDLQRPRLNFLPAAQSLAKKVPGILIAAALAAATLLPSATAHAVGGAEMWTRGSASPGRQEAMTSAVDAVGNVVVAGTTTPNGILKYYHVVKFKADGTGVLWTRTIDTTGGDDSPAAVAVDSAGDVLITGYAKNGNNKDILTVKLKGTDGTPVWQHLYAGSAGGGDYGTGIAVDSLNNAYVVGYTATSSQKDNLLLLKHGADGGTLLWQAEYDGNTHEDDHGTAVAVGSSGVAVTGYTWSAATGFDWLTIKYNFEGTVTMTAKFFNSTGTRDDRGLHVAFDAGDNIVVAGYKSSVGDHDIHVIKYRTDGTTAWQYSYAGEQDAEPRALFVEPGGEVFIAGYAWKATGNFDIFAARVIAATGVMKWEKTYNSNNGDDDFASAIVTDSAGNVFVAGHSFVQSNGSTNFRVQKYGREAGDILWNQSYNYNPDPVGQPTFDKNEKVVGAAIATDGGIYAIGWVDMWTGNATDFDYYVRKVDPGVLDPPSNLTGNVVMVNATTAKVDLSWTDNTTTETQFRIERRTGESGTYGEIGSVGANVTAYTDNTVTMATRYYYRVRAYNATDGYSHYSPGAFVYTVVVTPVIPIRNYVFDGGVAGPDKATAIAVGADNHPVITGHSLSKIGGVGLATDNFYTVKLDRGDNHVIWSKLYDDDGTGMDVDPVVMVDGAGDVVIAGSSYQYGGSESGDDSNDIYATKYAGSDGTYRWDDWFGNPDLYDMAVAVVRDSSNNYFIVGYGKRDLTNEDIRVMKYAPGGADGWGSVVSVDNGGHDIPTAAAVDPAGNLFVTGYRQTGGTNRWFTAKLRASDGAILWTDTFPGLGTGEDRALAIVVDAAGNPYVTGFVKNGATEDYYTIKYDGSNGTILWQKPHVGPGGGNDRAVAIKMDPLDGTIVVTGQVFVSAGDYDIHTIRYDALGNEKWSGELARPGTDEKAVAMAMDPSGNISIAGSTGSGANTDMMSIRYSFDGTLLGMSTYGAAGKTDAATSVAVNSLGEAYVAGYVTNASTDFAVYKVESTLLQAPLPLTLTPNYSQMTVSWIDNSQYETGYTVQRKLGSCSSGNAWTNVVTLAANAISHIDVPINQSTTYCYRVRAYKSDGEISRWVEKEAMTLTPAAPGSVSATSPSTTQINVSWADNTTGETGFRIERCTGENCTFDSITTFTASADATSFNDTTVCSGQKYSYRVVALKTGQWESAPGVVANVTATPAVTPTVLVATRTSEVGVTLTWNDANADEKVVKIERCTGPTCNDFTEIGSVLNGVTTFYDSFCKPGETYRYRVLANKVASCSWTTPSSDIASTTTSMQPPSVLNATAVNTTRIDLNWNDTTGSETGFRLYRCVGASCSELDTLLPGTTSYSDTAICNNTTYTYKVEARNDGLANGRGGCWTKRRPLVFANPQADFATKITVNYDTDMKADFSDVRFYDAVADRELPYWLESSTAASAVFWVRTTRNSGNIYMYYGNPSALSSSSGSATFDFWDDFNDLSAWTISGTAVSASGGLALLESGASPTIYRDFIVPPPFTAEVRYKHPNSYQNRLYLTTSGSTASPLSFDYLISSGRFRWNGVNGSHSISSNAWYTIRWDNTETNYAWRGFNAAGTEVMTNNYGSAIPGLTRFYFSGTASTSSDLNLDWVRIRRYASPDPGVTPGTEETAAGCYGGFATWVNDVSTATVTTTASAPPGNLSVVAMSENRIDLSWTKGNNDESGVKIYRCSGENCDNFNEIASLPAGTLSFINTGLAPSTKYTYRVVSYKTATCSWDSTPASGSATTSSAAGPTGLTATQVNTTQIRLTWNDTTSSETTFRIERCPGSNCSSFEQIAEVAPNSTTYYDGSACPSTNYTYRIRAANLGLSNRYDGCWTRRAPVTFTNFVPNHQSKVVVAYDSDMKPDFSDIRFYDVVDGRELPYWIETQSEGVSALVWVKTGNNNNVYLYYGNPVATSSNFPSMTFDFFEGFDGTTLDPAKWAIRLGTYFSIQNGLLVSTDGAVSYSSGMTSTTGFTRPFVLEWDHYYESGSSMLFGAKKTTTSTAVPDFQHGIFPQNGTTGAAFEDGVRPLNIALHPLTTWRYYKIEVKSGGAKYYVGANHGTYILQGETSTANTSPLFVGFGNTDQVFKIDNIRIRRYAATEPSATVGPEDPPSACYNFLVTWNTDYSGTAEAATTGHAGSTLSAARISDAEIKLTWTNTTTDRTGFKIQRCALATCTDTDFVSLAAVGNVLTYNDVAVAPNTKYTYRVAAYKEATCGWTAAFSAPASATTSVDAPTLTVNAPTINTTALNLSWTDPSGSETGFRIERCGLATCNNGDFVEIKQVGANVTAYVDETVCSGVNYKYRVRTSNTGISNSGGGCWPKRKPLTISNFQPHFQMRVDIPYAAGMQPDFRDIRFYDAVAKRELSYWIESKTDGVTARVWIRTRGNNSVYVYYGNSSATGSSNGDDVFDFFDDFSGTVISDAKWGGAATGYVQNGELVSDSDTASYGMFSQKSFSSRPFVLEFRHFRTNDKNMYFGIKENSTYVTLSSYVHGVSVNNATIAVNEDGNNRGNSAVSAMNAWQYYKIEVLPTGARYYTGDLPSAYNLFYDSLYSTEVPLRIGISTVGQTFRLDDLIVRKYAEVDPTIAVGAEEAVTCFAGDTWDSSYSSVVNRTATAFRVPTPSASSVVVSETQLRFAWTESSANTDESGYKVYRCTGAACADFTEVAVLPPNTWSYIDDNVLPLTEYTYRVSAYKDAFCSWPESLNGTKTLRTDVTGPTGLAGFSADTTTINLTWTDLTGSETGFRIDRCTDTGGGCSDFAEIGRTLRNENFYSDRSVCNTSKYTYRVQAVGEGLANGGGGCWRRRAPLTISGFQPNFQMRIVVPYDPAMQPDFDDVRFYDETVKRELSYWIESKVDGVSATVIVKTLITANVAMYWGNTTATAASNQAGTFDVFDDFSGWVVDTAKWTVSNGQYFSMPNGYLHSSHNAAKLTSKVTMPIGARLEVKARSTLLSSSGYTVGGLNGVNLGVILYSNVTRSYHGGNFGLTAAPVPPHDMLYTIISKPSGGDITLVDPETSGTLLELSGLEIGSTGGAVVLGTNMHYHNAAVIAGDWDWIRARKYSETPPTATIGATESSACYAFTGTWQSGYSNTATIQTVTPSPPTGFSATAVADRRVDLAWTDTTGDESAFVIQRCTGANCSDFSLLTTPAANVTTYTDTTVDPSTIYRYRVRAQKTSSCPWWTPFTAEASDRTFSQATGTLTAQALNSLVIKLDWEDRSTDEEGFQIEVLGWNGRWSPITTVGPNTETYTQNYGLQPGKEYKYRIRPFRGADASPYSNVAVATAGPANPADGPCR